MNAFLWILQVLLAVLFTVSASLKGTWSKERLITSGQSGVAPFPLPLIRLTAASEMLGALGLVLPRATGIAAVLTPIAAVGLCVVMVGAIASHSYLLRGDRAAGRGSREVVAVLSTGLLLVLLVVVAVGRA